MNPFKLKHWHPFTGILHFSLAFFTTACMFTSLFVPANLWVFLHGIFGSCLLLVVIAHWIWNFCYQDKVMLRHQFPLQKKLRGLIWSDLCGLFKGTLPPRGRLGGLPGMTEGFGLLAVTVMASTGPFLFGNYLTHNYTLSPNFLSLLSFHGFFANFIWIYWCGHVGMALLTLFIEKKQT